MKYEVISLKTGKRVGCYLERKMAEEHRDYIVRHGGRAEVRELR